MISAVLVCLNEGKKVDKCLASIKDFADEVVVVDLGSTDNSQSVYKKYRVKVFEHSGVEYVELVRNYSISKATGDWILVLDPDEEVGEKLKKVLKQVSQKGEVAAVSIPRKNIFFGRWISHSNWWPDYHVRFFKKGKIRWGEKIHKYPQVSGPIINLEAREDLAIRHAGYSSISEFMDRQNRYSDIEAKNMFDNKVRFSFWLFFWRSAREFLVRYIKHKGFMDGFYGFALTFLMMVYQFEVLIKLWELERKK